MNIRVEASTKEGHVMTREEALLFGGRSAGICYTPGTEFSDEAIEDTEDRIHRTLRDGHQSVYEHPHFALDIIGMPKMLVMLLNNQNVYVTSEKSARYTQMEPIGREKELFTKWLGIIAGAIEKKYSKIREERRIKLAQENARYMTSVFTPTTMRHTLSFRQINFFLHWFDQFTERTDLTEFEQRLVPHMQEFRQALDFLYVEQIDPNTRLRKLSLFAERERSEEFGENYSINYEGSPAQLAQAQRHRTLRYEMGRVTGAPTRYFVPPIIAQDTLLTQEWLRDMESVAGAYPQGMLITINERGTLEDFISKLGERMCGRAQLEIVIQTNETLGRYLSGAPEHIQDELTPYSKGARCTFPDYNCKSRCGWGAKKSLTRLI